MFKTGFYISILFLLISASNLLGQGKISSTLEFTSDTIQFDSVSVYRTGFEVKLGNKKLADSAYFLDPINAKLLIYNNPSKEKISLTYERTPFDFGTDFSHKSTDIIVTDTTQFFDPFIYSVSSANPNQDLFGTSRLNKQGSISRGVTVGNAQNLSLQSTLNLQLDGQIAPNLFLKGSISDDNVPFQPEGNTQKLQEFDQVYLKVYNDDFAVIGGDFWLRRPQGYFLNYTKRSQGVSLESYHSMEWLGLPGQAEHKFSGAFSKGKFSRNIIQGVEGNQGPYRLTGAENETFIIVLAGTERVFLDGKLMTRGQEFDYVIDYNTAEVTFTANNLITKDVRIIVEFQYSDLNFARSLIAYNGEFKGEKYHSWVNVYSEQDARNQTIQQTLTPEKREILSLAGDSLLNAVSSSIDSIGYFENRILYKLIDSTVYDPILDMNILHDSVLVFTTNPDSAIYQAFFTQVDQGQGDYVFDRFTANGRVYKWVAPVDGVKQGNYAPVQLLIAPQKKQMFVFGTAYQITKNIASSVEIALSNHDLNTFSDLHAEDNQGVAVKWDWKASNALNKAKTWKLNSKLNFEYNEASFQPIQWFRSVEFDRDWNVRNQPFSGNQYLSGAQLNLIGEKFGNVSYNFENFVWGTDYLGIRNGLKTNIIKNGWKLISDASYLVSQGLEETSFLRHQIDFSKDFSVFKVGFQDIHETNEKRLKDNPVLQLNSYRFYDWKAYVSNSDSSKRQVELYYRERYDWLSDSSRLNRSARARNIGTTVGLTANPNHILRVNLNYRQLEILDTNLFQAQPENTILSRLEHILRLWRGAITSTTFYELGSGLELKREFVFIEVNDGQGTHTWIDYNNDGVKDLGEFEIAVFSDQGNYIRVFVPTNTYVRTYSNLFSNTILIRPEAVWRSEKGVKKVLSKFSTQTVYKINRKTSFENGIELLNPFVYDISDTNLVSISSSFRNTLFFNKTNSVFGINYTYQENGSKVLLSNGFDSRLNTFHEAQFRWNISKYFNLRMNNTLGRKKNSSDYAIGRDYFIDYYEIAPVFSYQPGSAFRLALNGSFSEKENNSEIGEKAILRDVGIDMRYNQVKKGSFSGRVNFINIDYNAALNTSIAFEMLEGLQTGNNFTWGLSYQRKIAKNLQININYNGRKSEESNAIHSGGMELRAFF